MTVRGSRVRLALVTAVALATLAVGMTGAAASTPTAADAAGLTTLGASAPAADTSPRTPLPGYLLQRGRYTRFDAPGAGLVTGPNGINNRGQVVGYYVEADADGTYHAFRRDARGRITEITIPGAAAAVASKINDRGQIVGRYYQTTPFEGPDARFRGFLLDGRRLIRIDKPGAVQTQALGINNRGQVVGEYQTPDGRFHGFRWERGRFVTIDRPGAATTSLVDINDRGMILGVTGDPLTTGTLEGFVLDQGRFTTFRAPGAPITFARDLNNRGQIVGFSTSDPP
jgi:probable HAF family extracellular repeat protein